MTRQFYDDVLCWRGITPEGKDGLNFQQSFN